MSTTAQPSEQKLAGTLVPTLSARMLGGLYGFWLGLFPVADFLMRPQIDRATVLFDQYRTAAPYSWRCRCAAARLRQAARRLASTSCWSARLRP